MENFITFITPSIGRKSIYDTYDSIVNQTNSLWLYYIIFDDVKPNINSTDSRVTILRIPKKGCSNYAANVRNYGMERVTTTWIGFVDDDDVISPDYIQKLLVEIELNPDVSVVIFRMLLNDNIVLPLSTEKNNFKSHEVGISFAMKKELVCKGFKFIPGPTEDYTLLHSIRDANHQIVVSPYTTYFVRRKVTDVGNHNRIAININKKSTDIKIDMDRLTYNYNLHKTTPSDINEHLETFSKYAQTVGHITEFGVRSVVSSWGFLYGLKLSQCSNKKFVGLDLNYHNNIGVLKSISEENGIPYEFIQGSSTVVDIEETDILFIDTWHIYGHLKRELAKQHNKVRKYIMLHDTTIDEFQGETLRNGWDPKLASQQSGYPIEEITKGLSYAISEFLEEHPEWCLEEKFTYNNGLTILKRV